MVNPGVKEEAEGIVTRNEAILSGIRTLRATIELKQSRDGGKTWETLQKSRVARSGRKEIVRTERAGSLYRGVWRPGAVTQIDLFEPEASRTLSVSPKNAAGINFPFASGAGGWLNGWKAQMMLTAGEVDYRGLLTKSRVVGISPGADDPSGPTLVLTLEPKLRENIKSRRIRFSPGRGYLVTGMEIDLIDPDKPDKKKVVSIHREVVDVWELSPGLILPKTIRSTQDDEPGVINLFEIRDVVCNEPIPESEFSLTIPEGTIVVDNRDLKFHIWGKKGPARTFASTDEFNDWKLRQSRAESPPRVSALRVGMTAVAVACVVVLVGLFAYRRRVAMSAA